VSDHDNSKGVNREKLLCSFEYLDLLLLG